MKSPIGWPGGKRALVKTLLPLLPAHRVYVEPFCGSAKLLFAKDPSKCEVISDANGDLMNFFMVAKYRPSQLAEKFDTAVAHPAWFKHLRFSETGCGDEVCRAFRFLYLNWLSFGCKGEHFGSTSVDPRPRKKLSVVSEQLAQVSERLKNVLIEQGEYAAIVRRYDSPETLFYCDPPYVHYSSNGRYAAWSEAQLQEFFKLMEGIKGKFLLSQESCPEVAKEVRGGGFVSRRVKTTYSMHQQNNAQRKSELLIANFSL